jgi:hypothetical protein
LIAPRVSEMAASPGRCRPSSASVSMRRLLLCSTASASRLFLDGNEESSCKGSLVAAPPGEWSVCKRLAADWSLGAVRIGPADASGGLHDTPRSESGVRQGTPCRLERTSRDQAPSLVRRYWRSAPARRSDHAS